MYTKDKNLLILYCEKPGINRVEDKYNNRFI